MDEKDLYNPYINDNGRKVSGTAAHLHYIHECGGLENYNKKIVKNAINTLVDDNILSINENIIKNAKKEQFKKIG